MSPADDWVATITDIDGVMLERRVMRRVASPI
jgi:hypothetical protein